MRTILTVTAALLMAFAAHFVNAQTAQVFDLSGMWCNSGNPEHCSFHFGAETYWHAGESTYFVSPTKYVKCDGPGKWTQTIEPPIPLGAPVTFTFGCEGLSAAFTGHTEELPELPGSKSSTIFIVDDGSFMVMQ